MSNVDFWIRIGPLLGGGFLMMVCAVAILRNPAVSNLFVGLLAFAALLFVIPALAFFNFEVGGSSCRVRLPFPGRLPTKRVPSTRD
jgi:hypothetical protein